MVVVLNELGRLWLDRGQPARALAAHQRALAIGTAALDPSHSDVAEAWLGLGRVLRFHAQLDAAARHVRRGTDALERSMGSRHVYVGAALTLLGQLELELGQREAAREHLERAVDILDDAEGPPARRAAAWFGLAQVLSSYPGEREGAMAMAEQARQAYVEAGEAARGNAEAVQAWIAAYRG
jgi:tetratricopeptide (TPR) repeat protein